MTCYEYKIKKRFEKIDLDIRENEEVREQPEDKIAK